MNNIKKIAALFLVAGIGGFTAIGIDRLIEKPAQQVVFKQTPAKDVKLTGMAGAAAENSVNFVNAADMTVHAVVHIKTTFAIENQYNRDPFYSLFFGLGQQIQRPMQPMSAGSGVIVTSDGYIVTNNHVVENADKIEVVLNDKRSFPATVIGRDPNTDLALLKIKEKDLPYVTYGNSDDLKVGEWVLAVGNPFNLTSTVTAGIVSAKGRNLNVLSADPQTGIYPIESYIQTDAAINPGNSGGALVNTAGQLIGINAAIKSNTGSYTGYSFAIPVNIVKKVTADLLEYGEVQRAFIGVSIGDLDSKFAQDNNLKNLNGVLVKGITSGGAGEEAGIQEGDIITKIADVDVNNMVELQEQIGKFRPGDKITVTLKRKSEEKVLPITLKNHNGNTAVVKKEKSEVINSLGASFEQPSNDEMKRLNIKNGLKIVRLNGGKLRAAGIREGFIITRIDKKEVSTLDDLKNTIGNKDGGVLIEGTYPNGVRAYYGFGL
ncbi:MAG: trypsin-like peptidase domain-containing protein [Bacteroidia bacterium]|nr:trypsin-like peptidase domain-containing protein [Bacteroidia bacterium]